MSRINIRQRTWKVELVTGKEVTPTKDGNRKMLQVQFPKRSGRKVNGKLVPPPRFYVDIPKHFFNTKGTFTAKPAYEQGELIEIQWTGWGQFSGWIDINTQQRGAGGGGDDSTTDCAKWS